MTRPKGSKNKKPYPKSPAVITQRQSACITRRRKREDPETGEVVEMNDKGKLNILDNICDGDRELYNTYKQAVVDHLGNPLIYLAKKTAELEVAIAKQRRKDSEEDVAISPELIKATELALKSVDVMRRSQESLDKRKMQDSGRARRVIADVLDDKNVVLDADFKNIIDGEDNKKEDDKNDN